MSAGIPLCDIPSAGVYQENRVLISCTQKRRGNFAQFFPRHKFFGKQVLSTEHEDRPNASSFLSPVAPHWGLVVQVSPRRTTPSKPFELEQSRHTTKVCFCRTIQLPKRHPLLHAPHAHNRPSRSKNIFEISNTKSATKFATEFLSHTEYDTLTQIREVTGRSPEGPHFLPRSKVLSTQGLSDTFTK